MSQMTQLKIFPGYPIQVLAIEKPKFDVITLQASGLSGCDLDCALAVSLLTQGTLYLAFLPDGRSYTVSYEAAGQSKRQWSPSSDMSLSTDILRRHLPSWNENDRIEGLRKVVINELGTSVDLLRLKRNAA